MLMFLAQGSQSEYQECKTHTHMSYESHVREKNICYDFGVYCSELEYS